MSLAKQEFTNAGRSMLGRAQNGETLTITKIVVGEGSAAEPADLWPLTALVDYVMDVTISTKRDYGNGTMLIEGSFRSDIAPQAFYMKEVGVMAHIEAEADRLYSVANVFLEPADYVDPAAPTIQAFKIKLVIDRIPTENLIVEIGPTENVLGENVLTDNDGHGPYKEAVGNVLYFKRFAQGDGIAIDEDEDENIITIRLRQLQQNVDLYVPEDHPNAPNPDVAFPTIQEAHDYLLQFRIPADKRATIHVYSGTFAHTGQALYATHPDSRMIYIIGEDRVDKVVGSIIYVDPDTKRLSIANESGLVAGVKGYMANCHPAWSGGCEIQGTPHPYDVLASIEKRDSRPNYQITDSGAGRRFSYYPTVVTTSADPDTMQCVFNCPYGIGGISNILAVGGWAGFSISGGTLYNVQAWGCTRGVNSGGGGIGMLGECVFTQCDFGITALGTLAAFEQRVPEVIPFALYVNACTHGIMPSASGFAIGTITTNMDNTVVYLARNFYAVNCAAGGTMVGGSIFYSHNNVGFRATAHSTIELGAAYPSIPDNNQWDLYAQGLSYIVYDKQGIGTALITSPAPETSGNENAFIHVIDSG